MMRAHVVSMASRGCEHRFRSLGLRAEARTPGVINKYGHCRRPLQIHSYNASSCHSQHPSTRDIPRRRNATHPSPKNRAYFGSCAAPRGFRHGSSDRSTRPQCPGLLFAFLCQTKSHHASPEKSDSLSPKLQKMSLKFDNKP